MVTTRVQGRSATRKFSTDQKYEAVKLKNKIFKRADMNVMRKNHCFPTQKTNKMCAHFTTKPHHLPAAVRVRSTTDVHVWCYTSRVRWKWRVVARIHNVLAVLRETSPSWTLTDYCTAINSLTELHQWQQTNIYFMLIVCWLLCILCKYDASGSWKVHSRVIAALTY